jgi:uncharacterized delta-60 repeat protein
VAVTEPDGTQHGKIGRITPDGQVTEFETPSPYTLVIRTRPDGNLWFTEGITQVTGQPPQNPKIGVMSPTGVVLHEFSMPGGTDPNLAFAPDGTLWVSEYWNNEILHLDQSGDLLARYTINFGVGNFGAYDITVAPDGTVWLTSAVRSGTAKLGRITANTPPGGLADTFSFDGLGSLFRGIVVDQDRNIWTGATDVGKVAEINPDGQLLAAYSVPTPGSAPYSLAVGPDGNIWFTDNSISQVGRITLLGQVTVFPTLTPNSGVAEIAAGPGNSLWFTEQYANQVGRFDLGRPPVPVVVLRDANGNPASAFNEGDTVTFDASGTTDPEGDPIVSYQWDFNNDGWFDATGPQTSLGYRDKGVYQVRLKVTDSFGVSTITVINVVVKDVPPAVSLESDIGMTDANGNLTAPEGSPINLSGTLSDPDPQDLQPSVSFSWTVTKNGVLYASANHNSSARVGDTYASDGFSFTPDDNGTYIVTLSGSDTDGSATSSQTIDVTNVAPTIRLQAPAGQFAGDLDPSFGAGGIVADDLGSAYGGITGVVQQPDGKIVTARTYTRADNTYTFALVRYLANGALDSGFGQNGVVLVDLGPNTDGQPAGIVVQPDGKIVVAGTVQKPDGSADFGLVRLNSDGTPDTTFGPSQTGVVVTDLGGGPSHDLDFATSVTLQGDDILVAGRNTDAANDMAWFALARYTAAGILDQTFGADGTGIVLVRPNQGPLTGYTLSYYDGATDLAVQDGHIYLTGTWADDDVSLGGSYYPRFVAIVRFDANGSVDTSYGGAGPPPDGFDEYGTYESLATPGWAFSEADPDISSTWVNPARMAIQPTGAVVVTGHH